MCQDGGVMWLMYACGLGDVFVSARACVSSNPTDVTNPLFFLFKLAFTHWGQFFWSSHVVPLVLDPEKKTLSHDLCNGGGNCWMGGGVRGEVWDSRALTTPLPLGVENQPSLWHIITHTCWSHIAPVPDSSDCYLLLISIFKRMLQCSSLGSVLKLWETTKRPSSIQEIKTKTRRV